MILVCFIALFISKVFCAPPEQFQIGYRENKNNSNNGTITYECHDDNNNNNADLGCKFNFTEIYTLASLQSTVYCVVPNVEKWNCTRCQSLPNIQNFQIQKFIYDKKWDLKAFVGYLPATDSITVVFRGTDMRNLENWLLDLESWETSIPLPYKGAKDVRVHDGFYRSYFNSILHKEVTKNVQDLLKIHGKNKNIKIVGHSMGAAFAELAALDFLLNSTTITSNIDVVTFGSPRVGNLAYYELFQSLFNNNNSSSNSINNNNDNNNTNNNNNSYGQKSWRMTNKKDPVPFLPPTLLGYHHVAREAWIESGKNISTGFNIVLCDGSGEDPDCHNSILFLNFDSYDHTHYFGLHLMQDYSEC